MAKPGLQAVQAVLALGPTSLPAAHFLQVELHTWQWGRARGGA